MSRRHFNYISCIYIISFLDTFSVGISIPLLAPYLKTLGASHLTIGLSSSLYGVAQLVSSPFVGSWSDHNGRLSVLTISLGICSLCYLLIGFVQSLYLILLLRFVIGCFKHTQSLCKAIIADKVPSSQQYSVYGSLYAVSSFGFVLGPAVGGHIAQQSNDMTLVSAIIMVCFWLNIALVQTLPSHQHVKKQLRYSDDSSGFHIFTHLRNINWKCYKGILMLKLCLSYSTAFYYNNFSLTLKEKYSLSTMHVGYVISFQSLIQALSAFVLGRVQKVISYEGARNTLVGQCFIMLTVAMVGLYQTSTLPVLLFWLVPYSISLALLRNFLVQLLVQNTSDQDRGSLLGTSNSITGLSRISVPLIAGLATDQLDTIGVSCIRITSVSIAAAGALLSFLPSQI